VRYLAEFYLPAADLEDVARRARAATEGVDGVDFVEAIVVAADENCFAIFDAASADVVAAVGVRARIRFDRIVEARTEA
jgi:hypothetical protein